MQETRRAQVSCPSNAPRSMMTRIGFCTAVRIPCWAVALNCMKPKRIRPISAKPAKETARFCAGNSAAHLSEQVVAEVCHELCRRAVGHGLVAEAFESLLQGLVKEAAVAEAAVNVLQILVMQRNHRTHILLLVPSRILHLDCNQTDPAFQNRPSIRCWKLYPLEGQCRAFMSVWTAVRHENKPSEEALFECRLLFDVSIRHRPADGSFLSNS